MSVLGKVSIDVDGKSYALQYTTGALVHFEEVAGMSVLEFMNKRLAKSPSIKDMAFVIWAGLWHNHRLELDQVYDLCDQAGGVMALTEKAKDALKLAFPDVEPAGQGAAVKPSGKRKRAA